MKVKSIRTKKPVYTLGVPGKGDGVFYTYDLSKKEVSYSNGMLEIKVGSEVLVMVVRDDWELRCAIEQRIVKQKVTARKVTTSKTAGIKKKV